MQEERWNIWTNFMRTRERIYGKREKKMITNLSDAHEVERKLVQSSRHFFIYIFCEKFCKNPFNAAIWSRNDQNAANGSGLVLIISKILLRDTIALNIRFRQYFFWGYPGEVYLWKERLAMTVTEISK